MNEEKIREEVIREVIDKEKWETYPGEHAFIRKIIRLAIQKTRKQVLEEVDKQFKKIWAECPIDGFTVWHWESKVLKKLKFDNAPVEKRK